MAGIGTGIIKKLDRHVGDSPSIILGPWTGEVGYELLYWIPFLRWLLARTFAGRRIVAVSRGGVASWYADLTDRYVDVFELASPDEIAAMRASRRVKMRGAVGAKPDDVVDRELAQRAASRAGLSAWQTISARFGYWVVRHSDVYGEAPFVPARINPPDAAVRAFQLPDRYAVCRFYAGGGTPDRPDVHEACQRIAAAVSRLMPVVNLDPHIRLDHHHDFPLDGTIPLRALEPRTNLETITSVVAGANLYIGSYGGMSYLGPYLGIPTVVWLAQSALGPGAGESHLAMARRLFASPAFGDYIVVGPEMSSRSAVLAAFADALGS